MGLLDRLLKRRMKAADPPAVLLAESRRVPAEPLTIVLAAVPPASPPPTAVSSAAAEPLGAVEPTALETVGDRREQRQVARQACEADTQYRHEQELAGKVEDGDRHSARRHSVRGKPYYLWVPTIEQLKRESRHEEVLVLLYECIAAAERDRGAGGPAPAYTEHAAIVHRKMGDHDAEVKVLKRWLRLAGEHDPKRARMGERLAKASALQQRTRVPSEGFRAVRGPAELTSAAHTQSPRDVAVRSW